MADDPIKSFMVSLGFKGDEASAKKAVDLAAKTEAAITKAGTEGADKCVAAETQASGKRIGLAGQIGKLLTQIELERAEQAARIRKDEATKDQKIQEERERKARERRTLVLKEMQASATKMAAFAIKTVVAIEATALGIVYATDKAAKSMERLNYSAARSGNTPGKMTAAAYAFSQLGSTAESGQAAVTSIGNRLKENPAGYATALKSIGIEARKANGEMKDAGDLAADLGEAFARIRKRGQYGYANARNYAGMFGLDDDQMQTMSDPRYRGMVAEQQAIDAKAGANRGAAAEGGTAFEQSMRRLTAAFDSVATRIDTELFQRLKPRIDDFARWLQEHGKAIADVTASIIEGVAKVTEAFVKSDAVQEALNKLGDSLGVFASYVASDVFKRDIKIFTDDIGAVAAAISKALHLLGVLSTTPKERAERVGLDRVTAGNVDALHGAMQRGHGPNNSPAHVAEVEAKLRAMRGEQPKDTRNWWQRHAPGWAGGIDTTDRRVRDAIIATAEGVKKLADNGGGLGGGGEGGAGGAMSAAARFLRYAGAAAGAGFAGSASRPAKGALAANQKEAYAAALKEGLSPTAARALVANMSGEGLAVPHDYHWDGTHMAQGIVQWDPTRSAQIKAQFGKDPKDMSVAEQTKAAIWEMRTRPEYAATKRAMEGDNGPAIIDALVDNYERPGDRNRAKAQRYGYYRGFNPDAVPAATASTAPIGDKAALEAEQRIASGKASAGDAALIAEHRRQQNTPSTAPTKATGPAKPYPSSETTGDDGEAMTTVDRRDPRFAPGASERDAIYAREKEAHQHLLDMQLVLRAHRGHVLPFLHPHAHLSPAARNSIDNSQSRHVSMVHNPTFNVSGGDPHLMLADAHRLAGRGQADMVRNLSVAEA